MPTYFFDVRRDAQLVIDTTGGEFEPDRVRAEATGLLVDMLRETVDGEPPARVTVEIRDNDGRVVLKATASFTIETFLIT